MSNVNRFYFTPIFFLCEMQKELEQIEYELSQRIYRLYLERFDGNKSKFAEAAQCSETTIRRVLSNKQGITINLLIRMAKALETDVLGLLAGLSLK